MDDGAQSPQSVPSAHALISINVQDLHWVLLGADPGRYVCSISDCCPSLTASADAGRRLPRLVREALGHLAAQILAAQHEQVQRQDFNDCSVFTGANIRNRIKGTGQSASQAQVTLMRRMPVKAEGRRRQKNSASKAAAKCG